MFFAKKLFYLICITLVVDRANGWLWKRCCNDIQKGYCFSLYSTKPAPKCPSTFSPTFTLYTRTATTGVRFTKESIPSSFSNNRGTVFLVHGYTSYFNSDFAALKDALLKKDDWNVIATDWKEGAKFLTYSQAASNTRTMGALIGAMVNELRKRPGSKKHFWCIGHSLGAHVCGNTRLTAKPLLDRITGCDPAGPLFLPTQGLIRSSASKVDIIHTDNFWGSIYLRGHVDFFPNGGKSQPGCPFGRMETNHEMTDEEKIKYMQKSFTGRGAFACSHSRALFYMTQSVINTQCYVADKSCKFFPSKLTCETIPPNLQKGVMGYDAINHNYEGILYLKPSTKSPYCT